MTWYDVEVTLDGDYIRRYAIEADSVADADKIALARIPEFNVAVNPLGGEPDDDIELNFDAVIPHGGVAQDEVAQGGGDELARLEAEFAAAGGRGVELADRIDALRAEVAQGEVGTIIVNEVDGRVASVNGAPPGYVVIARDWDAGDTPDENGDLYEDRTL